MHLIVLGCSCMLTFCLMAWGLGEWKRAVEYWHILVPLLLIPGVISNIPPFVMSQQGQTDLVVWGRARAIHLIKGETAPVL